jgi:hypothetical protein
MLVRMKMLVGMMLLSTSLATLGCGSGGGVPTPALEVKATVPASGIVKYKGQPLKDAAVTFFPLDGKTIAARGKTDGVGSFKLSTYASDDGAPVGKYKVLVAVSTAKEIEPGVLDAEPVGGFKSPIPAMYSDPSKTDILVEIKAGDKNEFMIELK